LWGRRGRRIEKILFCQGDFAGPDVERPLTAVLINELIYVIAHLFSGVFTNLYTACQV
jgi:predicted benzoate:H+ symporter BenE